MAKPEIVPVTERHGAAAQAATDPMAELGCCADRKYGKGCTEATCMELPEGKTCGNCVHVKRCVVLFGHTPTDTYCDFFPRRFRDATGRDVLRLTFLGRK